MRASACSRVRVRAAYIEDGLRVSDSVYVCVFCICISTISAHGHKKKQSELGVFVTRFECLRFSRHADDHASKWFLTAMLRRRRRSVLCSVRFSAHGRIHGKRVQRPPKRRE